MNMLQVNTSWIYELETVRRFWMLIAMDSLPSSTHLLLYAVTAFTAYCVYEQLRFWACRQGHLADIQRKSARAHSPLHNTISS